GNVNAGTVDFKGSVSLAADVTVQKNNTGASATSVQFEKPVDGAQALTINATTTKFDDQVGNTVALTRLTTDAAGTTTLKGNVNADTVDFKDAVSLAADLTLQKNHTGASATSVEFEKTVDGAQALTVEATTTKFGDQIGNTVALSSLTTDAAGTPTLK